MVEKVILYVMAGEDESKDLQEGENSYYRRLVSEEGGFGSNTNSGFNSQESTDVDSRDAITSFGDSDYDIVDRDDEEDDDNFDGDDEDFDNDAEDFDGDDDYDDEYGYDDYDDEDDDDDEDEEDEEDEDENDEDDDEDGEGGSKGKKGKKGKDKDKKGKGKGGDKGQFTKVKKRKISPEERAAMKAKKDKIFAKMLGVKFIWHEGEEITLETLQQYWPVFSKHVESLRVLMEEADAALESLCSMSAAGDPNLMMKLNKFVTEISKDSSSFIQSILDLIAKPMWLLALIFFSSPKILVGSLEVWVLASLSAILKGILKSDLMQGLMEEIFTIGMKELKKKFNYKGIVVAPK